MSVKFDNNASAYLERSASLPTSTSFTMCGWANLTRIASVYQYWGLDDVSNYMLIGYPASGNFEISSSVSPGGGSFSSNPTDGTWFFWAITNSGTGTTDYKGYWAAASDTSFKTCTGRGVSFIPATMRLGNDGWGEYVNGLFAYVKVYDAVLTSNELWIEMLSIRPFRTTSLHIWSPLFSVSDVVDYSGNGRNWTVGNSTYTISDPSSPPVSWTAPLTFEPFVGAAAPTKARPPFQKHTSYVWSARR